jgi:hypothetical protein
VFSGINHIFFLASIVSHFSQNKFISQLSGVISHIIDFIVVVFPAQFGHKNQYISQDKTSKQTLNKT